MGIRIHRQSFGLPVSSDLFYKFIPRSEDPEGFDPQGPYLSNKSGPMGIRTPATGSEGRKTILTILWAQRVVPE